MAIPDRSVCNAIILQVMYLKYWPGRWKPGKATKKDTKKRESKIRGIAYHHAENNNPTHNPQLTTHNLQPATCFPQ